MLAALTVGPKRRQQAYCFAVRGFEYPAAVTILSTRNSTGDGGTINRYFLSVVVCYSTVNKWRVPAGKSVIYAIYVSIMNADVCEITKSLTLRYARCYKYKGC